MKRLFKRIQMCNSDIQMNFSEKNKKVKIIVTQVTHLAYYIYLGNR